MSNEPGLCPKCGGYLEYGDEVDIGVGTMRGNLGCPDCHWVPEPLPETADVSTAEVVAKSAGDLLIAAVDNWAQHAPKCIAADEACPTCEAMFNQVVLAHKVWQSSAHKAAYVPAPLPARQPEICICAAWQTEEGLTFRGHRHSDARDAAIKAFCRPARGEDAQGFITSTGRFVDRREGRRLHEAADTGSVAPGGYRGDLLFSEDLY